MSDPLVENVRANRQSIITQDSSSGKEEISASGKKTPPPRVKFHITCPSVEATDQMQKGKAQDIRERGFATEIEKQKDNRECKEMIKTIFGKNIDSVVERCNEESV
jgi:hypothetical protein